MHLRASQHSWPDRMLESVLLMGAVGRKLLRLETIWCDCVQYPSQPKSQAQLIGFILTLQLKYRDELRILPWGIVSFDFLVESTQDLSHTH